MPLSDHMQRTAAASADHVVDIEPYIVTWLMIGQRLAMVGSVRIVGS